MAKITPADTLPDAGSEARDLLLVPPINRSSPLPPITHLPPVNHTTSLPPFDHQPSAPPVDHRPVTAGKSRAILSRSPQSSKPSGDWSEPGSSRLSKKHACILVTVCAQVVIITAGIMVYLIISGQSKPKCPMENNQQSSSPKTTLPIPSSQAHQPVTTIGSPFLEGECARNPCYNGGTCVEMAEGGFVCICPVKCDCVDMGPLCEKDPFNCTEGPSMRNHPLDCRMFIWCVTRPVKRYHIMNCSVGTYFDPQKGECEYEDVVMEKCHNGWKNPLVTTAVDVTTTTLVPAKKQTTKQVMTSSDSLISSMNTNVNTWNTELTTFTSPGTVVESSPLDTPTVHSPISDFTKDVSVFDFTEDTTFYSDNKTSITTLDTSTPFVLPTTIFEPCASSPCLNGGTCIDSGDGNFTCQCPGECICTDMGPHCETNFFDCSVGPSPRVHPDNCQLYIECYKGRRYYMTCPRGTYYDPQIRDCNIWFMVLDKCEEGWEELSTYGTTASFTAEGTSEIPTN